MSKIHMVLQGKGGVGKSFVASILSQYKIFKKARPLCIDTDPVNSTFLGFKALNVKHVSLMEDDEINPRNFDTLIEMIAQSESDVVIDNGASSFVPLSHYLISNHVPTLLESMGHDLVVHTVVTGGQAMLDTVNGFGNLISQFPEQTTFVVWLNPYWGAVGIDGKTFEDSKVYLDNKNRISALIDIPAVKAETFGRDLSDILRERLTFDEAIASDRLTIMSRQRLKIIRDQLFIRLENAAVL